MEWQSLFVETLNHQLEAQRAKNPRYSLRKFARVLGVSPGGLSEVLKGRLPLSAERASHITSLLELNSRTRERLLAMMGQPLKRQARTLNENEEHILLTDWRALAILHLFDLEDFAKTAANIGERLALPESEVQTILSSLVDQGFLRSSAQGLTRAPEDNLQTSDGPSKQVIRRFHEENLKVAALALKDVPAESRDFTAITFSGNSEQLELVRAEIRALHERVSAIMGGVLPHQEIYRLSVSLFPLNFAKKSEKDT